jgi:signal transduction histidine kinase
MSEIEPNQIQGHSSSGLSGLPCDTNGDVLGGRFKILRLLKQGQGIRTFLATDRDFGDSIVLKLTQCGQLSGEAIRRLNHEATILRRLSLSRGVSVRSLSYHGDTLVLAYPFVPGITLAERIARKPLSPLETVRTGISLLQALTEAHECDVLHGDVKPSNLIVPDTEEVFHGTLIDFGLSRTHCSLEDQAYTLAGTAHYLSPEQSGLIDAPIDGRSDLYSAGILLYECLAGKNPIGGETLNEVLRNHLLAPPPSLRLAGVDVPGALDEIVRHLIQRDPQDRYQKAEAALADLEALERLLARGHLDPPLAIGAKDTRTVLTEPAFIGRTAEVGSLLGWWAHARAGKGGLVLVESESGGGKTRLLEELASRSARDRAWILRGQGLDQAAQAPFQVLAGVAEGLVDTFRARPSEGEALKERLGDQGQAAGIALPQLSGLFGSEGTKLGPEDFGEIRNLQALGTLLDTLGTAERPALLLLDDCQWADGLTLKLLAEWQRKIKESGRPLYVLVIAAFRSEEVLMGHAFRRMRPLGHLVVPPFQQSEISDLVRSMAGPLPASADELIGELAGGSPFLAGAVLRGLVEIGALRPEKSGWTYDASKVGSLSSSRKAASFLIRRLELLPAPHIELLSVGAILGKEFSLSLATSLTSQTPRETSQAVEEARKRHLIWPSRETGLCAFVHDKIREALLARLPSPTRRSLHLKAAKHLQTAKPDGAFELAYHFDAAGDHQSAFPFALLAAEQARSQHSLEIAEQQYRIAARGVPLEDAPSRRRIAEGLGEVLLLKGNYSEAEAEFHRLQTLSETPFEQATIAGKLGEIAFKQGDVAAASSSLEHGLRLLGRHVPRSNLGYALLAAWEILVQTAHTLLPKLFLHRRRRTPENEPEFLAMRLLSRMAYVYWFGKGNIACAWAHFRELNLAERYEATPELAQAYSEQAPVMTLLPYFSRGIRYVEKSLAMRRAFGDLWGQGQSLHFHGVVLYAASRFEESIEKCREAVRLMERTGDRWELNTAGWHTAFALHRLGELREATRLFKRVLLDGQEIGDHQAVGISLDGWSRASEGAVPAELIRTEMARQTGDALTRAELWFAEGTRLLLGENKPALAAEALERAIAIARAKRMRQEYVVAVHPWLATALRKLADETRADLSPKRTQALRRRQAKAVRGALRRARFYRNSLPHALREAALYQASLGHPRRARRLLDESLEVSLVQHAKAEAHETRKVRFELARELGWPTAQSDERAIREYEESAAAENHGHPSGQKFLSLADRFETMLDEGRNVLSSTTRETVLRAAESAAKALLRAEKTYWLSADNDFAAPSVGVSRKLLKEALEAGRPVTLVEGAPEKGSLQTESILLGGIRSALCAPVYLRGKIVGCLYLSHRGVSGLFEEEERRLAQFLTALVSVALENAAGFEDLRAANLARAQTIAALEQTQKELQRQTNQLTRSNEDLESFAFAASHDLKEPLRMVTTYLQLLERRTKATLEPEAREYVQYALKGAHHMFDLIDGLLSYSRVRSESASVKEVDLGVILDKVSEDLKMAITESGARIGLPKLPVVWANEIQMGQLFQNLFANAIKFRSAEPPRIEVSCEDKGAHWCFRVKDNGIGLDPKHGERIFQMFKRLHGKHQYPGSGIGLALCRRVVEMHGGAIGVESAPNEGATFWFTLPKGPNEAHSASRQTSGPMV